MDEKLSYTYYVSASAKVVNDMLLSWGYDPEECYQETFFLEMGDPGYVELK